MLLFMLEYVCLKIKKNYCTTEKKLLTIVCYILYFLEKKMIWTSHKLVKKI